MSEDAEVIKVVLVDEAGVGKISRMKKVSKR